MTDLRHALGMADCATIGPRERASVLFPKLIRFGRLLVAAIEESRRRQAQAVLARHPHLIERAAAHSPGKAPRARGGEAA